MQRSENETNYRYYVIIGIPSSYNYLVYCRILPYIKIIGVFYQNSEGDYKLLFKNKLYLIIHHIFKCVIIIHSRYVYYLIIEIYDFSIENQCFLFQKIKNSLDSVRVLNALI